MKWWLQDNDVEMYSAYNKGISAVAERFIQILKNKIYMINEYMTLISKKVYITKELMQLMNIMIRIIGKSKWNLLMWSKGHILTLL